MGYRGPPLARDTSFRAGARRKEASLRPEGGPAICRQLRLGGIPSKGSLAASGTSSSGRFRCFSSVAGADGGWDGWCLATRPRIRPRGGRAYGELMALIQTQYRPRVVRIPRFTDEQLAGLGMPVLAIVGGRDVMLDSEGTRRRLALCAPRAELRYLPEAPYFIPGQAEPVLDFLRRAHDGRP